MRTSRVVAERRIGAVLHYVVRADDGTLSPFVLENGRSRLRSELKENVSSNLVLSELDGAPMILSPGKIWVERAGTWTETALEKSVVGPEGASGPIVLGVGSTIYAGFDYQFEGVIFVISYPSGAVTRREWPDAIHALARAPGKGCVLVAGANWDLGSWGALRTLCGSKDGPVTYFRTPNPKALLNKTYPVPWVGNRASDTLVVAGGVRRLSSPKTPPAEFGDPICMCGYLIARAPEDVFEARGLFAAE